MNFPYKGPVLVVAIAAASAFAAFNAVGAAPAPESDIAKGMPNGVTAAAAASCHFHDGAFTGDTYDAYYGEVQIKANIASGCVTSIDVLQYPADRRTSRRINEQALPILESEVIQAQNGRVDIVTGATLTSRAYIRSLKDALAQAGK